MSSDTGRIPIQAPSGGELTEEQCCGRTCVWCEAILLGRPSVDLGERVDPESGRNLFLRACPECTRTHVYRRLVTHTATCEQCVDDAARCPDSAGLRHVLREGRRV
ncbi:MAG: hypothetical protein LBV60_23675 [Streptomyces sp.]|jgi:hypothetical protein|nr:hypothetical protein [Streptomyces sp.]